ncbi:hypothetical protein [Streptomyces naphthomycinicus]|uniref:hypothetical protein n=1 Tax=Streptomyces naphthomycinicus TaxID=2872625 RepID=UPI001CED843B|nr:hypothetical protein [Streptomyces sp. TML10]
MDDEASAGSGSTTAVGRLALGATLLASGLGTTGVIDGVTASDAVSVAHYVGGVALFLVGLLAAGGWAAVAGGAVAWYAGTAALAHWPTALPRRAAGRGVTATG